MEKRKNFWDKNAGRYDRFMHKDAAAYEQLYELLRPVVRISRCWSWPPAQG